MGWDFIEYEGDHEQFKDFDLWTLSRFFVEAARTMETAEPSLDTSRLREFFEGWTWCGPGVFIGTDFSKYVMDSNTRWELLFQLLQRAGDRIARFGEFIPLDYLAEHVNTRTAYFIKAPPTRQYLICIGRICTLLSKHEPHAP
jgi:hypothetical protein